MVKLHPQFLTKDGRNEFVVLQYDEFVALNEMVEDARDLLELEMAREAESESPTVPLSEVAKRFGLSVEG